MGVRWQKPGPLTAEEALEERKTGGGEEGKGGAGGGLYHRSWAEDAREE